MNEELKGTLWTTIWVVCVCILLWVLMAVATTRAKEFDCAAHVGCGTHIVEQFPEGHGR